MTIAQTIGKPSEKMKQETKDKRLHPLSKDGSLRSDRFSRTEVISGSWTTTLPDSADYQMVFEPRFWRFVSPQPKVGDTIFVRNDSLTYFASTLVVAVTPGIGEVELRELSFKELAPALLRSGVQSGYAVNYEGVTLAWTIRRVADDHIMASGIQDRVTALKRAMSEFYGTQA